MGLIHDELRLNQFGSYIRREAALRWVVWGLIAGLSVAAVLNLAARLFPIMPFRPRMALSVGIPAIFALIAFLIAYTYPRSALELAQASDARMGLYARLATAIEIERGEIPVAIDIAARQRADAIAAAKTADPGEAFKLVLPRRQVLITAILVGALAIGLALPNPQESVIERNQAEREAIERQVERLEKVRDDIAANPNLSQQDKEALLNEIDDTIGELREGALSKEEAVARFAETEENLKALLDEDAEAMASALDEAGRQAEQGEQTQEIGEALVQGDYEEAAQAMTDLGEQIDQMSPQEQDQLAERLEAMATAVEATHPELAQALRDAADALERGDVAAAQEALQRAAALTAQAGEQLAAQQATEQALGQVQEGRREIAQSGQEDGQGQTGEGEAQPGIGMPGEDQGKGQSGSGHGDADEAQDGQGTPADPGGPIDPNQPGKGGEKEYDPIYAPERLGDGEGELVEVPGQGDDNGPPTGKVEGGPLNDEGQVLVPYDQVYADYEAQAASALENSYIPRGMKDYIRAYFSSLEPNP